MATTIVTKFGGDAPAASDIVRGELAVDTENGRLYTENSSGAVVEIGLNPEGAATFGGEVLIPEKLGHVGDTDTHFKFAGANDIRIVAGDVEHAAFDGTIVFNQSGSSSMDFRVESDTKDHMLFVDASLNRIGIANNAPATALDVTGTVTADGLTVDGNILLETSGNPTITNKTSGDGNNPLYRLQADTNYWDMLGVFSDADNTFRIRYNDTDAIKIANNGDISFYEDTGTTAKFFWDASAESLGIGTSSPSNKLDIKGTVGFEATNSTNKWLAYHYTDNTLRFNYNGAGADELVIDSSGNVGIGTDGPDSLLHLKKTSADVKLTLETGESHDCYINFSGATSEAAIGYDATDNALLFCNPAGDLTAGEAMRIDASGNLLVGTTSTDTAAVGFRYRSSLDAISSVADGGISAYFGRRSSDGDIVTFRKDDASVGSIGVKQSDAASGNGELYIASGNTGLFFDDLASPSNYIRPCNASGALRDNIVDLGKSDSRFKDLYLSGNVFVGATSQINSSKTSILGTSTTNVLGLKTEHGNYLINGYSSTTEVFRVASSGNVTNTNNSYGSLSDERLKSNIVDASSQLDDIMAVQVRSYTLDSTGETHIGVVAQELESSGMSGLVSEDKEGMKSVKYSVLYMKAIKAIQEQQATIEALTARIAALES